MKEEITHTWVIENYDMCFQSTESKPVIKSPWIYVGNPVHSAWCLELYSYITAEDQRTVQYHLDFLEGSFYGARNATCEVLLVGPDSHTEKVKTFYIWSPSLNKYCSPIETYFLPRGTLTLQCKLTFKDVPPQYEIDLTDLSEKISTLYGNEQFSDLTLYTDKKEFFLHKFLLRKRAPELFNGLGLRSDNMDKERVKVDNISTPVLYVVLRYVYSGKLDSLPEKYLPELYETLKKYQFTEFDKEIVNLKSPSAIYTQIKVHRRNFYWHMNVKKSLIDGNVTSNDESQTNDSATSSDDSSNDFRASYKCSFVKYICIDYARFLIQIWFSGDLKIVLNIDIRCLSPSEDGILLKCTASLGVDENYSDPHPRDFLLLFTNEKKLHSLQKQTLYKCSFKGSLMVKLNLAVSKSEHTTSVDSAILTSPERQSLYGLCLLSYQLDKLIWKFAVEEDVNEMEDVTLNFENGSIKAHRAIVAFSEQFCTKINDMVEKNSDQIDIHGVDFDTGKRLLGYMYSGQLSKSLLATDDMKLYVAAKKLEDFLLFRKCSKLLVSHLHVCNACELLVLAYNYDDESLLEGVQRFIESNRRILGSEEWVALVDTNPLLVSRILKYVTSSSLPASQNRL